MNNYTNQTQDASAIAFTEQCFAFYAQIGAALLPVQSNKHPVAGFSWTTDSSTDPAQWQAWLDAGHGLALNAGATRLIIVDIDAKGDRDGAWKIYTEHCIKEWGYAPDAIPMPAWSTRSGGWHVLFRAPEGKLYQPDAVKGRINVRAGNGYVVCPPTPGYLWLDPKV